MDDAPDDAQAPSLGWRRRLSFFLVLVLVGSVGARVWSNKTAGETKETSTPGLTTLVPGADGAETEEVKEEPTGIKKLLPFVTEGAFAMLLGLALGIATRMIFKMLVLGMVLFFLATQFLAYKGLLTVDWGQFWVWTRDFVLNVSQQADLSFIVQHKLPAVGAFIIGYLLGLKRG